MYRVTKNYGHVEGLSCCFRQWRADSHCNMLHGYSLSVQINIDTSNLDDKNWVFDFGSFKYIKDVLHQTFDHTTLISEDDPELATFKSLNKKKLIDLRIINAVGCEKFAEHIFNEFNLYIIKNSNNRACISSVKVSEHEGNSATYINNKE
tara:strand:- start:271 stop:720 length:450 start_codon:yes stop_codon:yes gene_type:complete